MGIRIYRRQDPLTKKNLIVALVIGVVLLLWTASSHPVFAASATSLTLSTSSNCVKIGDTFTLSALLTNGTSGHPISGKTIVFQDAVNSSSFADLQPTETTGSNGIAEITYKAGYNGTYTFRARFEGYSDFFNPANNFNGSLSNRVIVQTSNSCTSTNACGFLGSGCLANEISNAFAGAYSAISGFFGTLGTWLNPITWLNALGVGWLWNAFLNFIDVFLIFFQLVFTVLPYLGFVILMINLFYVVKFDFEGLFGFWEGAYSIVSVVASAIIQFVQLVVDIVKSITGGAGGVAEGAAVAA